MSRIDRRSFLQGTGLLAAGTLTSSLQAYAAQGDSPVRDAKPSDDDLPPPVFEPFEWKVSDLAFSFEFLDKKVRFRSVLPAGVSAPKDIPGPTVLSGLETSIHCTGEDPDDHHGLKLTGGSPGTRLIYLGKKEVSTEKGKRFTIYQSDPALGLKVESIYETYNDLPIVRRSTKVTNTSKQDIGIEYLSSAMLHNLASPRRFEEDLRIHFAHNTWQAEAQWRTVKPSQAGFIDNGNFTISPASFDSVGTWSTNAICPWASWRIPNSG